MMTTTMTTVRVNKILIFTFMFFLGAFSFANEIASQQTAGGSKASGVSQAGAMNSAAAELNNCKPENETVARKAVESAGLSKEELLARVIYSESLSTGYWNKKCNANSVEDIMTSIGWGIMNRVKNKAKSSLDAYSDAIFAKQQFTTSFSSAKPKDLPGETANVFAKAFLCPLSAQGYLSKTEVKSTAAAVYKAAQETASKIINTYEFSGGAIPVKYKNITNFFYPQSEFNAVRPKTWGQNPDASKNKGYMNLLGVSTKACAEFYNLKD